MRFAILAVSLAFASRVLGSGVVEVLPGEFPTLLLQEDRLTDAQTSVKIPNNISSLRALWINTCQGIFAEPTIVVERSLSCESGTSCALLACTGNTGKGNLDYTSMVSALLWL